MEKLNRWRRKKQQRGAYNTRGSKVLETVPFSLSRTSRSLVSLYLCCHLHSLLIKKKS